MVDKCQACDGTGRETFEPYRAEGQVVCGACDGLGELHVGEPNTAALFAHAAEFSVVLHYPQGLEETAKFRKPDEALMEAAYMVRRFREAMEAVTRKRLESDKDEQ